MEAEARDVGAVSGARFGAGIGFWMRLHTPPAAATTTPGASIAKGGGAEEGFNQL